MSFLLTAAIAVLLAEVGIAALFYFLKRDCPWLISSGDLTPPIDADGLQRFLEHGWDTELGWVRKANTQHDESGLGGRQTGYSIDETGARADPTNPDGPLAAVACGDSYTFCRQVNDEETWPYFLSSTLGNRVRNIGVGNYGIDQALLRLEREFDDLGAPAVIMGVVPETICRVQSVWKHFSEYGNIFAFKPRFALDAEGTLGIIPNPIKTPDDFFKIPSLLEALKRQDGFYDRKFHADMMRFPYLFHLARTWRRTPSLMAAAFMDRFAPGGRRAFKQVMRRNIQLSAALYRDQDCCGLLAAIVRRFSETCRAHDARPILLFMPQLLDLKLLKAGDHFYAPLLDSVRDIVDVVDMGPEFSKVPDEAALYIEDGFGGHLTPQANAMVAQALAPLLTDTRRTAPGVS